MIFLYIWYIYIYIIYTKISNICHLNKSIIASQLNIHKIFKFSIPIYIHIWEICVRVFKYIWYSPLTDSLKFYKKLAWVGFEPDHWVPFKRFNRLSYHAMSSTRTQSQIWTATPISSFVQCHISFRLLAFVSRHVNLIEVFCR